MDYDIFKIFISTALIVLFFWLLYNNSRKRILDDVSYNFTISKNNRILKWIFFGFSLALLISGYLNIQLPDFGDHSSTITKNIIFIVDVSKSMDTQDISHDSKNYSRLGYSKYLISKYMNKNKQNNYSLIAFAGDSQIISPLTQDLDSYLTFLDNLSSDTITKGGSDFGKMMDVALTNIGSNQKKNIVILSDGGDKEDNISKDKFSNISKDVRIFTVGIGTKNGDKIPMGQDLFGNTQYKQYNGEYVTSNLNEDNLKLIADLGNGTYMNGTQSDDLGILDKNLIDSGTSKNPVKNDENRIIIISISFILLLVGYLIPYRYLKGKK